MSHPMRSLTRRRLVQSGLLLSLAAASPLRALSIHNVAAEKNDHRYSKSDIKKMAQKAASECKDVGGTPTISERPGGTTMSCTGGKNGDYACTYTSKGPNCYPTRTQPYLPVHPLEPDLPFTTPGDVPNVPLQPVGGGVVLTSYGGGSHDQAARHGKHRGTRHRRKHGRKRKG